MAAYLHIRRIVVECDSVVAINLLNSAYHNLHANDAMATLIGNCHVIMQLFESCQLQHILYCG